MNLCELEGRKHVLLLVNEASHLLPAYNQAERDKPSNDEVHLTQLNDLNFCGGPIMLCVCEWCQENILDIFKSSAEYI